MPDANGSAQISADLTRDARLLQATVREAGALALRMSGENPKSWIKGESSPVSEADIAANDLIERRLRAATPDYGWLSEESPDEPERLSKKLVWVIDPIDGTRAYLAGQKDWAVSAALVENGRPILGAVFAPATAEFFFAASGEPSRLNGEIVATARGRDIVFPRLAGPKPLLEKLQRAQPGEAPYPRIGSLALRLCRVSQGVVDAAFAGGNSRDWDLAAADLIVHQAGGRMTSLDGEPLRYNTAGARHGLLLAAGSDRHRRIVEHFRSNPVD